jgi:hypothetical protein
MLSCRRPFISMKTVIVRRNDDADAGKFLVNNSIDSFIPLKRTFANPSISDSYCS